MALTEKGQRWVPYGDVPPQPAGPGVTRRVLAYTFEQGAVGQLHSHPHTQITYVVKGVFSFTIGKETRIVRQGDTLLKEDGVEHGCTCVEAGILLDIFAPMRQDFI